MTKTIAQVAAFALAAVLTAGTFAGADAMATQQYIKADAVAVSQMQVLAAQTVIVVGHRG